MPDGDQMNPIVPTYFMAACNCRELVLVVDDDTF